jgi:hypothetical protein
MGGKNTMIEAVRVSWVPDEFLDSAGSGGESVGGELGIGEEAALGRLVMSYH